MSCFLCCVSVFVYILYMFNKKNKVMGSAHAGNVGIKTRLIATHLFPTHSEVYTTKLTV